MEAITYLATFALALVGGSERSLNSALVGTWRVQVSQEVLDVAHKMGLPEPEAQFVFKDDNTFSFTSPGKKFSGTYLINQHNLALLSLSEKLSGELKNGNAELDLDGLVYKRQSMAPLVGTWVLRNGTNEDAVTKVVFKADGTFQFTGFSTCSKGKYVAEDNSVRFEWTEVDDEPVTPGSIHKSFPFNSDGSLQIDTFKYVRQQ